MLEGTPTFIDSISNYSVPLLFGLGGILVGGAASWLLSLRNRGGAKPFSSHKINSGDGQNVNKTPTFRPISSTESQLVAQIEQALAKVERHLAVASAPLRAFSLEEKLRSALHRLTLIAQAAETAVNRRPQIDVGPRDDSEVLGDTRAILETTPTRTFLEDFRDLYNTAHDDRGARNEFWGKFSVLQLGNRNTTDQRMGRVHEPDFRTTESLGDFIAVQDADGDDYLVVPSFTIAVDDTSFRFGGLEAAFSCDFQSGATYQSFKVVQPARFARDADRWLIRSKGELQLLA